MSYFPRRITLAVATALAVGAIGAAPANATAEADFTYDAVTLSPSVTGVKIYNWVAGSTNCPAALSIPSTLGGQAVVAIAAAAFADKTCMSPAGATRSVTVPASTVSIGEGAFATNAGLTRVTFAGDPGALPKLAFAGDSALAQIVFLGGGPTFDATTFSGVPTEARVFYKAKTKLHSGADWPEKYADRSTYVYPEFGVAGLRAGQVSRKSKRVYFFPTVGTNVDGYAYLVVYAKVKKNGHTYSKLMCSWQVRMDANTAANMQCDSVAARKLLKKRRTTFYAKLTFQSLSGYTTSPITKSVTLKRK